MLTEILDNKPIFRFTTFETSKYDANTFDIFDNRFRKFSMFMETMIICMMEELKKQNSIIEIDAIVIPKADRNIGYGSKLLTDFTQLNRDSLIITLAGATVFEYDREPTDDEYTILFEKLDRFYTRNNFRDVTSNIGYEYKRPYIYIGNKIGEEMYNYLISNY